jgi:hypothetical protein
MRVSLFLLTMFFSISALSQMKMSVDPKTSKMKYDVIGEVTSFQGDVFKKTNRSSSNTRLGLKFGVKKGDIISTGRDSFVKINLIDDTIISLGPESIFSFEDYSFDSLTDRDAFFNLLKGKMRIKVKNKIERGNLKFNTLTMSFGVRGTEFLANQDLKQSGESFEQIALLEGEIELSGKNIELAKSLKPRDHLKLGRYSNNKIKTRLSKLSSAEVARLEKPIKNNEDFHPFLNDFATADLAGEGSSDFEFKKNNVELNLKDLKDWKKSLRELNEKYKK